MRVFPPRLIPLAPPGRSDVELSTAIRLIERAQTQGAIESASSLRRAISMLEMAIKDRSTT